MLPVLLALSLPTVPAEVPAPARPVLALRCSLGERLQRPQWEPPGMVVEVVALAPLPEDRLAETQARLRAWVAAEFAEWRPAAGAWSLAYPPPSLRVQGNLMPEPAPFGWRNWP